MSSERWLVGWRSGCLAFPPWAAGSRGACLIRMVAVTKKRNLFIIFIQLPFSPGQHLHSPLPAHTHAALLDTLARHQVGILIVVLVIIACVAFIMSIITIIMIIRQPWRPVMCNNMLHLPSPSLLTSSKQLDFLISLLMGMVVQHSFDKMTVMKSP